MNVGGSGGVLGAEEQAAYTVRRFCTIHLGIKGTKGRKKQARGGNV